MESRSSKRIDMVDKDVDEREEVFVVPSSVDGENATTPLRNKRIVKRPKALHLTWRTFSSSRKNRKLSRRAESLSWKPIELKLKKKDQQLKK